MKHKLDGFSQYLIGSLFTFVFVTLVAVILFSKVPVFQVFIISFIGYLLLNLILSSRLSSVIFFGISGLTALFTTFVCWVDTPVSEPVLDIVEGIITLWYKIFYNEPYKNSNIIFYAWIFLVFSGLIASILVTVLFKKHNSFFILSGLVIAMTLFSWYMTAKESQWLFALSSCLIIVSYMRHVYMKKKKANLVSENVPVGTYMLFTLPLVIISSLIIHFLPKDELPLQWPWLDSRIAAVIQNIESRYSQINIEFFSLSSTGFSGRTHRLGGPAAPNNTVVMDVKTDKRTYLRGAVYSWYENNAWVQSRNEETENTISEELENEIWETKNGWTNIPVDEMFFDAAEEERVMLSTIAQGMADDVLFPVYPIEVEFRNMTTRTLFMPLKSILPVKNPNGDPISMYVNLRGDAISEIKLTKGSKYTFEYIQPMYGEPMLKKALTFSRKGLYKDARDNLIKKRTDIETNDPQNEELVTINNCIENLLRLTQRASNIENEYTQLNENITQRIKDQALELTANCKSDYEKVVTIENYLRENYSYTLSPSTVPQDKDFVDYFLFEEREGYCTYYATAMTVLLRSAGIPARYVEGYVLPDKDSSDEKFIVTNRNAHAWVEVYFEGFGWLVFEPTSAYANIMDYRQSYGTGDTTAYPTGYDMDELRDRFSQDFDIPGYFPLDLDTVKQYDLSDYLYYIPIFIAGLIILLFLINKVAELINTFRYKRLKNNDKILKSYENMLVWLSDIGYIIKPGETVGEFSVRIDGMFYFSSFSYKKVTDVFYKVRYGKYEAGAEEIKMVHDFSKELKNAILKDMGIRRYIPLRLLILGI